MKAKIKSTGEIVNVHEDINGDFVTESGSLYRSWQLEFENEINWEQRRYEIAKSALQGQLSNQYGDTIVGRCEFQHAAETSVKFADALIAELQKGGAE